MKRILVAVLFAAASLAAYGALKTPALDEFLTREAPAWAGSVGLELRLRSADFDPWGPSLRLAGVEVGPAGGGWVLRAEELAVRVRFLRSLGGDLHLEAEATAPRLEGEAPEPASADGGAGQRSWLPGLVFERLRVTDGAVNLAAPEADLRVSLPRVEVDWAASRGTARVVGGFLAWRGGEEPIEELSFEGERRFAAVGVDHLRVRTRHLDLRASGRVGPWRLLDLELEGVVALRDLPAAWVAAAGLEGFSPLETEVRLAASLGGSTARPVLEGSLALGEGSLGRLAVSEASARWTVDRDGVTFQDVGARTSAGGVEHVRGSLTWGEGLKLEARGRAVGYELRSFMGLILPGWFPVGVTASGDFRAQGPLVPELALECEVDLEAHGLDVTLAEGEAPVFSLPSAGVGSRLTVGTREIRFGPTRVETASAAVAVPEGRIVYAEGLWFDTDVTVRDLGVARQYVPPGYDARGRARGSFGGPYAALVFAYDLDLSSAVVGGQDLGRLQGAARYDLRDLALEGLSLEGPAARARARGAVGLHPEGEYRLEVEAEVPDLASLAATAAGLGLPVPEGLSGSGWARGRLGGRLSQPAFDGGAGAAPVSAVVAGVGLRASRLEARGHVSAAGWSVEAGEVEAYGARAQAAGAGDREGFHLGGTLSGASLEALAEAFGAQSPVAGEFSGSVEAAGPYGAPRASATGTLRGATLAGHPAGEVDVEARYRDRRVTGEARGFGGAATLRGELGLAELRAFSADAALVDLPWDALPRGWLPEGLEGGSLSGRLQARGSLGEPGAEPGLELSWTGVAVGVGWRGLDLGRVDTEGRWGAEGLRFSARLWEGEAAARGALARAPGSLLDAEVTLQALRLARLRPLLPAPGGRITAQGRARVAVDRLAAAAGAEKLGALADLSLEGAVTGLVVAGGVALPEWTFAASSPNGRPEVRIASEGVRIEATLEEPGLARWGVRVSLEGFAPSRLVPEDHRLHGLQGTITAEARARGVAGEVSEGSGAGRVEGLAWGPILPSDWAWSASWGGGGVAFEAKEPRGVGVRGSWAPGRDLAAELALSGVRLAGWVDDPRIPDDLAGEARGLGEVRVAPGGEVSGRVDLARLMVQVPPLSLEGVGPVRLAYQQGEVRLESVRLAGDRLDLVGSGGFRPGESWDLDVDGTLDLEALRRLVKGVRRAAGTARAEIELRGPWASPRLAGPVSVEAGASLALEALDLPIEDLDAAGFFDAEKGLIVEWVDAQVGRGRLHLEGGVGLEGLRPGRLRLLAELRNIAEERPPQVSWLVDADLLITGTAESPEVRGDLRLKEFLYERRVNLKTLVFDALRRRPREVKGAVEPGAVFVDVSIRGDEDLRVENNVADLTLDVDLRARGYLPRPVLWGRVEAREGTVRLRSQEYDALRSSVEFLGETQPVPLLDVHVRTTVRQYAITVDIAGPLDDYQVTMASMPPLPQNDIVALLTVGTTSEELQDTQAVTAAEAASFLTGRIQDELESEVGDILGFDQFHIDPAYSPATQTTVPRVTVGKAISRAIFARYSAAIGGETEQDLEVQYSLSPRLSLLGTWTDRGSESEGSLGGEVRLRIPFR